MNSYLQNYSSHNKFDQPQSRKANYVLSQTPQMVAGLATSVSPFTKRMKSLSPNSEPKKVFGSSGVPIRVLQSRGKSPEMMTITESVPTPSMGEPTVQSKDDYVKVNQSVSIQSSTEEVLWHFHRQQPSTEQTQRQLMASFNPQQYQSLMRAEKGVQTNLDTDAPEPEKAIPKPSKPDLLFKKNQLNETTNCQNIKFQVTIHREKEDELVLEGSTADQNQLFYDLQQILQSYTTQNAIQSPRQFNQYIKIANLEESLVINRNRHGNTFHHNSKRGQENNESLVSSIKTGRNSPELIFSCNSPDKSKIISRSTASRIKQTTVQFQKKSSLPKTKQQVMAFRDKVRSSMMQNAKENHQQKDREFRF